MRRDLVNGVVDQIMLSDRLQKSWEDLQKKGLVRTSRIIERVEGPFVWVEGRERLLFASNDYLGLGQHPKVLEASRSTTPFGWAPASSRLLSGTTRLHISLEERLAEFLGTESALFFPSGYMANLGLLTSVAGPGVTLISDAENHASLIDACRLSRARVEVFPHADIEAVREAVQISGEKILLTDSVFSMSGQVAPLRDLSAIAQETSTDLIVDEAHGFGIFGEGRGMVAETGVEVPLRTITLSKAAGSIGGAVAGKKTLVDYLRTKARTFMFTTSPPSSVCAAALASLSLLEEGSRREKLWENIRYFSPQATSPIIPFVLGENRRAVAASETLWESGFWVPAIRPPAVAEGGAQLRISLSALHTKEHLDRLRDALDKI
ncbi:MAG: 8-amino-7-oxononanoate synthase [Planctomycetota bacterium]|nr:8-amino-7-oxononanoate synthase [Planctomycetota bacterium]